MDLEVASSEQVIEWFEARPDGAEKYAWPDARERLRKDRVVPSIQEKMVKYLVDGGVSPAAMHGGQAFDAIARTVSATITNAMAGNRIKKHKTKLPIIQIFIILLGQGRFIASV